MILLTLCGKQHEYFSQGLNSTPNAIKFSQTLQRNRGQLTGSLVSTVESLESGAQLANTSLYRVSRLLFGSTRSKQCRSSASSTASTRAALRCYFTVRKNMKTLFCSYLFQQKVACHLLSTRPRQRDPKRRRKIVKTNPFMGQARHLVPVQMTVDTTRRCQKIICRDYCF